MSKPTPKPRGAQPARATPAQASLRRRILAPPLARLGIWVVASAAAAQFVPGVEGDRPLSFPLAGALLGAGFWVLNHVVERLRERFGLLTASMIMALVVSAIALFWALTPLGCGGGCSRLLLGQAVLLALLFCLLALMPKLFVASLRAHLRVFTVVVGRLGRMVGTRKPTVSAAGRGARTAKQGSRAAKPAAPRNAERGGSGAAAPRSTRTSTRRRRKKHSH